MFFEVPGGKCVPTATSRHLHSWSTVRTCFASLQHPHCSSLTVLLPSRPTGSSEFQSSTGLEQYCRSHPPCRCSLVDSTLPHLLHTKSYGEHSRPGQQKLRSWGVGWLCQAERAISLPVCQKHFRRCAWKVRIWYNKYNLRKCCQWFEKVKLHAKFSLPEFGWNDYFITVKSP